MALLCCLRLLYSSISVKTSITLRLMGVSLSWMNRLGIELPIGSRGMGDKNQPAGNNKVYGKNNERPRKNLNFSTPKECFYKNIT